jgi:hypothetical protein
MNAEEWLARLLKGLDAWERRNLGMMLATVIVAAMLATAVLLMGHPPTVVYQAF